jgi:hypothetical protein
MKVGKRRKKYGETKHGVYNIFINAACVVVCYSAKNRAPSIAYLPSRFFQKKSLARKIKKIYFFYL